MFVIQEFVIQEFVNKLLNCSYLSLSEEAGREYRSQQSVAVLLGLAFSCCDWYVPGKSREDERCKTVLCADIII